MLLGGLTLAVAHADGAGPSDVRGGAGGGYGGSSPIEETVAAGNRGLQYDPATQTYTYVWKTNSNS